MSAGPAGWLRGGLLLLAVATAGAAPGHDALKEELQQLLSQQELAGAVYSAVDGEQTLLGAVGLAHAPTRTPLTPQARVHVGSVAKTVLSLAVLRLVSQGRVSLDTPVATLLPDLRFSNPWAGSHPLRLRHLLDHTAGLEDVRLWHLFNRNHEPDMPLADGLARHPALLRVHAPPGSRMSYSNIGYLIAGMAIERLTGERYEDWGRRELLLPLGMADSSFGFTTQRGGNADPRLAWGHLDNLQPHQAMTSAARPGAQFTSTAADMARLARFLMSDGRIEGQVFVNEALLRQMGRPHGTDAARTGLASGYALGLATRDRNGAIGLCHEGSIVGYRAMLCLFPQVHRAFFVAFNSDSESARYNLFYSRLTRHLGLGGPPMEPASPLLQAESHAPSGAFSGQKEHSGRYVPAPSRFQPFALLDLLFDTRQLDLRDRPARWTRSGGVALLYPAGPGLWRQSDRLLASHVLLDDSDGTAMVSDGLGSYKRTSALRWLGAWSSVAFGLAGLAWWLVAPVVRRWRWGATLAQPAWLAVLALPMAAAWMAAQGWQALGELTAASVTLWLATAALLPAMAWQGWLALKAIRAQQRGGLADLAAALAVLQAGALLAAAGLLPLAVWH